MTDPHLRLVHSAPATEVGAPLPRHTPRRRITGLPNLQKLDLSGIGLRFDGIFVMEGNTEIMRAQLRKVKAILSEAEIEIATLNLMVEKRVEERRAKR